MRTIGIVFNCFLCSELFQTCVVSTLKQHLSVPVTAKFRKQATVDKTVGVAEMLEKAGCDALCLHGRIRRQKFGHVGPVDIDTLRITRFAPTFF